MKNEEKIGCGDIVCLIIVVLIMGILFTGLCFIYHIYSNIFINQETANDICHNLSGNDYSIANSKNGKLICEIPTYDSTTNIIIKEAE